tara:strand:- start:3653 stop:3979 length:327 start_codon:yes stop_codon:yes gene_type:complete
MCGGSNDNGSNTIERQTQVDTFANTRNVGTVSGAGHSGLSTNEAASIALDPTSSMSTPFEKGLAAAQMAVPGGLVLGGLRTLNLRSHGGFPSVRGLLGGGSGKGLLGG